MFTRFMTMREKKILARSVGIGKENWGLTTHFSEMLSFKLDKKNPIYTLLCIFKFYFRISDD